MAYSDGRKLERELNGVTDRLQKIAEGVKERGVKEALDAALIRLYVADSRIK